jgi:single-strand DNA-binding protein
MYQQLTLVGNLGNDPEMRYTATGVPVTSFSVATSRVWTNQEGQRQEKTVWFRVTAWQKLAETASQYLSKGRQVLVIGELEEPDVWTDREGNQRASLQVRAFSIKFLGTRADAEGGGHNAGQSAPAASGAEPVANDEDIPF